MRTDLVIATVALLVSAGATISSVYQTHVVANQLSASVWPYVSIESDLGRTTYELSATNDGLGPALIRSARLYVDGKPVPNYRAAVATIIRAPFPAGGIQGSFASVDSSTVIRVADRRAFMSIAGRDTKIYGDLGARVSLELCYCSLLDQCWTVESARHRPRTAVAHCDRNDGIDY